jgi:hypothetical protein
MKSFKINFLKIMIFINFSQYCFMNNISNEEIQLSQQNDFMETNNESIELSLNNFNNFPHETIEYNSQQLNNYESIPINDQEYLNIQPQNDPYRIINSININQRINNHEWEALFYSLALVFGFIFFTFIFC